MYFETKKGHLKQIVTWCDIISFYIMILHNMYYTLHVLIYKINLIEKMSLVIHTS